jgi:hypothetical protein
VLGGAAVVGAYFALLNGLKTRGAADVAKFEQGDSMILGGNRHMNGGVNIGIGEAEQGERLSIFNRGATQRYKSLGKLTQALNANNYAMTYEAMQALASETGINKNAILYGKDAGAMTINLDDKGHLEAIRKNTARKGDVIENNDRYMVVRHGNVTKRIWKN